MLQKSSMYTTLEPFLKEPTKEHYLIDISREIKLAHTSVNNNLKKLVSLDLIKKRIERKGSRKFPVYFVNRDNKQFILLKKFYNLDSLYDTGLIDFLEEKITPRCVVLFGSYSRGEDTETSDIDLFIESKTKDLDIVQFERKLKRKIELHFNENFKTYPKELKNNILNGIILSGFLEGY